MGRTRGTRGAVSRTVARRLAAIEGCERRGESLQAYARRTEQSVWGLYEAKRVARRAGILPPHPGTKRRGRDRDTRPTTGRFVEAVAARPADVVPVPAGSVAWRLRLPGGAVVESTLPLDPGLLERIVAGPGEQS